MQIAAGVYSIGQHEGGRVHAFLLDDGVELTLIDTLYDTDGHRIVAYIQRLGRAVTDVKQIVLTHGHRSHLGGLAALKQLSQATVYSHEWEADIISGDRKAQPVTMIPTHPLRVYHLQLGLALGLSPHLPCLVERTLSDGGRVGPVQVMHTPGHSPGHLSFYWPERRLLIAGDAIATWPELSPGWPAFNLNAKQHKASLSRMLEVEPQVVAVGHGEPITRGAAQRVKILATSVG